MEIKLCLILCLIVLHAALTRTVCATIIVVSSVVNDSAFFNCATPSDSVEWLFGSDQYLPPFIYSYGTINSLYKDRFRIEIYGNGTVNHFNLILLSVSKQDAGRYLCRNESQNEVGIELHLIVLETGPTCDADRNATDVGLIIGSNSCGIESETIELSCSVRYRGNISPSLTWTKVGEYMSIKPPFVVCSDSGHTYTCNLTMNSDLQMDESSYICQAGSSTKQYNCTSIAIKVINATATYLEINATVNEKVSCFVNSSWPCNYIWKFNSSEEHVTFGQDVFPSQSGAYVCEAICPMRDKNCTIKIKKVFVSSQNAANQNVAETVVPAVVIPVALGLLSILIIVLVIYKIQKKNERERARKAERIAEEKPLNPGTEKSTEDQLPNVKVEITDAAGESGIPLSSDVLEIKIYKERIRGLTLLNNELYVTTERRNTVEVFDCGSKVRQKKLDFESLRDPVTMASCTINNCIYIMDKKMETDPEEIFKYHPGEEFASRWFARCYGRLSVIQATGEVVLAAYDRYRNEKTKLKIFSTDGTPLHTIEFSRKTSIDYLWHAVRLSHGDFIVSHGCTFDKSLLHRVCIVSQDGKTIKKSFGKERGPSAEEKSDRNRPIDKLNEPSYLAVTDKGSILVSDMKNCRVILLSKDLEFKKVFLECGEYLPQAMHFDKKNNQLFVGCNLKEVDTGCLLCHSDTAEKLND